MSEFDRDNIRATVDLFARFVRQSSDFGNREIAARVEALECALAAWNADGAALKDCGEVLGAASNLLTGLYDLNPEGLPHPYRGSASEVLELVDMATEQGWDVTSGDAHISVERPEDNENYVNWGQPIQELVTAVSRSADAGNPAIRRRVDAVSQSLAAWQEIGFDPDGLGAVFERADALAEALAVLHPGQDGMPPAYSDPFHEYGDLCERAESEGVYSPNRSPTPR